MMEEYDFDDSPIISAGPYLISSEPKASDLESNIKSSGKRSRSQVSEGIRYSALSRL
jgi:hypothetical protein